MGTGKGTENQFFILLVYMMRIGKRFYHFLGSAHCAILLISTSTIFVIIGTLLESLTESHLYASHFTYSNPVFRTLLWLFFVNILVSALRRWPFKWNHVPFLITHLGLLMILGGCFIKSYYGVQGTMVLLEGGSSQNILVADTYEVCVEKRDPTDLSGQIKVVKHYPLQRHFTGALEPHLNRVYGNEMPFSDFDMSLIAYAPHSVQKISTWIKGNLAYFSGLKPFPVSPWTQDLDQMQNPLPIGTQAFVNPNDVEPWRFYAFRSPNIAATVRRIYLENLFVQVIDNATQKVLLDTPLSTALGHTNMFTAALVKPSLTFPSYQGSFSFLEEIVDTFEGGSVFFDLDFKDTGFLLRANIFLPVFKMHEERVLFLDTARGSPPLFPVSIALKCPKTIAVIQNDRGDDYFFAFNHEGFVYHDFFSSRGLDTIVAYGGGFGGYVAETLVAFPDGTFFCLECPLSFQITPTSPESKLEDNIPQLTLALTSYGNTEHLVLSYDREGMNFKQPALQGNFLFSFQPQVQTIPYRIKLCNARQINYPNTKQPYSYESDLIITDTRDNTVAEKTISMNNVHETADGYRFYLASISPGEKTVPQRVQLVINRDPAKYLLTYPGAVTVAIGIILLFWMKKSK